MATIQEVFETMASFYEKGVAEHDTKGLADFYKQCAETYFEEMNQNGFTPTDIEYLDGYFIFGTGTNTIVHFHVAECPGWLFGIWWNRPEEGEKIEELKGELFAQFEENIDKFKPSASELVNHIYVGPHGTSFEYSDLYFFTFIRDEPHLAFCRDYLYWDYNREYHTREEAEQEYNKYTAHKLAERNLQQAYTQTYLDNLVELVKKHVLDPGETFCIYDRGEAWSPRYAPILFTKGEIPESGDIEIELIEGWSDIQEILNGISQLADEQEVYVSRYITHGVIDIVGGDPYPGLEPVYKVSI